MKLAETFNSNLQRSEPSSGSSGTSEASGVAGAGSGSGAVSEDGVASAGRGTPTFISPVLVRGNLLFFRAAALSFLAVELPVLVVPFFS